MRNYLFANGVDKDVVHLNDLKFFKTVIYVLVSGADFFKRNWLLGELFRVQVQDHFGSVFQVRLRRNEDATLLRHHRTR